MRKLRWLVGLGLLAIIELSVLTEIAYAEDDQCFKNTTIKIKDKYTNEIPDRAEYRRHVKSLEPGTDFLDIIKNEQYHATIKRYLDDNNDIPFIKQVIGFHKNYGCLGYSQNIESAKSLYLESALEGNPYAVFSVLGATMKYFNDKSFQRKLKRIYSDDTTRVGQSVYHLSQALEMIGSKKNLNEFSRKDIQKFCTFLTNSRDSFPTNSYSLHYLSSCYLDRRWKRDINLVYAYKWASLLVTGQEPNAAIFQLESSMTGAAINKAKALAYSLADIDAPVVERKPSSLTPSTTISPRRKDQVISTGSAFFIGGKYLITNNHVIDSGNSINLNFKNETINARVVAKDAGDDIAILELETIFSSPMKCFSLNNYAHISPGTTIYSAGFPLSQILSSEGKITDGIISSQNGMLGNPKEFQISSPLQPGNSGGPVFTSDGRLAGIAVSKLRDGENVNFAIKTAVGKVLAELSGISTSCNSPVSGISDYQSSIVLVEMKG